MQFFKITIPYEPEPGDTVSSGRRTVRYRNHCIGEKLTELNHRLHEAVCFFAFNMDDGVFQMGVISTNRLLLEKNVRKAIDSLGISVCDDPEISEMRLCDLEEALHAACSERFIDSDDEIKERYGLDLLTETCRFSGLSFGESLLDEKEKDCSRDELESLARGYSCYDRISEELDRIYTPSPKEHRGFCCIPTHYLLQVDDPDVKKGTYRCLFQALYNVGRLDYRRYAYCNIDPSETVPLRQINALYASLAEGGAVVLRMRATSGESEDDDEDTNVVSSDVFAIEAVAGIMKKYRNSVLTVLCIPQKAQVMRNAFIHNLGRDFPLYEIADLPLSYEKATLFLKKCAKEKRIRTDKRLFAPLDENKAYSCEELTDLFKAWYGKKTTEQYFPQYNSPEITAEAVRKNRGSAYDELMAMVGLNEAKAVIKKAVTYFKIQKILTEKGVREERPALHCIFTGNPGSAKTTVARIFSRILREEGILEKGHLIEVSRGDLVAKYVGHTARTVQKAFKEARGGCLFIDEAYSLATDNGGSFGQEAIDEIVKCMEDARDDTVVIFAGYPREMETFLNKNPGLRSRIAFHVPFADYSADELTQITAYMADRSGLTVSPDAMARLRDIYAEVASVPAFGNGRYVRTLLEQSKMQLASRLCEGDINDLTVKSATTLLPEDIVKPLIEQPEITHKSVHLGF